VSDDSKITQADPLTALQAGAASIHELYKAWVEAGFTRDEALYLIAQMLTHGRSDEGKSS